MKSRSEGELSRGRVGFTVNRDGERKLLGCLRVCALISISHGSRVAFRPLGLRINTVLG